MQLDNATELISGANRGLGPAFAREAQARAARRICAGVREPSKLTLAGGETIKRAVTRPADACRRWLKIA